MSEWEEIKPGEYSGVFLGEDGTFRWGRVAIGAASVILSRLEVGGLVCGGGILATTFTLPDGHCFKFHRTKRRWYRYTEGSD